MAGIIAANAKQGHNLIGSVKIVDMIHVLVANWLYEVFPKVRVQRRWQGSLDKIPGGPRYQES